MRSLFSEILDDLGCAVTTATSGIAGLKIIQQQPPDLVILDIWLPGLNGFEIYQKMQANPTTRHIPVLVATAWADSLNLRKAEHLGINHLLPKPFTEDELVQIVSTLLTDEEYP